MKKRATQFFIQIHGLLLLLVTITFAFSPLESHAEAVISSNKQCEYVV